jgi:hypothetical protein
MFKYWKAGAVDGLYKRTPAFKAKYANVTILDFIAMLKANSGELISGFTWGEHFTKTVHWINNTDYKHIAVVRYDSDLNSKLPRLLAGLGIPDKGVTLSRLNVSVDNKKDDECYKENAQYVDEFVKEYFKEDVELMDAIENSPERFKLVV